MSSYEDWLRVKMTTAPPVGIPDPPPLHHDLFPHQTALTRWALRRGRSAIFADTGLGKTFMELEWARVVSEHHGRVLILTPLAVAQQIQEEGERFGIAAPYRRDDLGDAVTVTNYDLLHRFDPEEFSGIVLDESSILKAFDGKTRTALVEAFAETPYRLCATATPAPNDHTELGNHSEFLGIKLRTEMLSEYFVHDGGSTQSWRLKGHAEDAFWRWVCTWAAVVRKPSDLGFEDAGFDLPPLIWHEHVLDDDLEAAKELGMLFAPVALTLNDQRAVRRGTVEERVEVVQGIVTGDSSWVIWCELNREADAVEAAIDDAVQVRGSDDPESKAARLLGFSHGEHRIIITKPSIAGFGLNWQVCHNVIFFGVSHSYEQTYQAVRRCWRFGQESSVNVHVIMSKRDAAVLANYKRKEAEAASLAEGMLEHMRDAMRSEVTGSRREWDTYRPESSMTVPAWLTEEMS